MNVRMVRQMNELIDGMDELTDVGWKDDLWMDGWTEAWFWGALHPSHCISNLSRKVWLKHSPQYLLWWSLEQISSLCSYILPSNHV